jgi:hydroxysqualene synthase
LNSAECQSDRTAPKRRKARLAKVRAAATIAAVSVDHYENFPVASWLCPPRMQDAVRAIYHYARTADDLADEGDAPPSLRLAQLRQYRAALVAASQGAPLAQAWPGVFRPLAQAIARHRLPLPLLHALLDAFEQDAANPRYVDRAGLLDYCGCSANPVGRLMLHLAGIDDAQALAESDAVCTALQLINFWQDPSVDLARGRVYFPQADLQRYGLHFDQLVAGHDTPSTQALLRDLCDWAGQCMRSGAPLARRVPGRLGWELRLVVQGGLRILERIRGMQYRTLSHRPTLGRTDWPVLLWRACWMPAPPRRLAPRVGG